MHKRVYTQYEKALQNVDEVDKEKKKSHLRKPSYDFNDQTYKAPEQGVKPLDDKYKFDELDKQQKVLADQIKDAKLQQPIIKGQGYAYPYYPY